MLDWFRQAAWRERSLTSVPRPVLLLLALTFSLQVIWHGQQPPPLANASALHAPPDEAVFTLMGLGDVLPPAKGLNLWLQAFDNQPGISIPFARLDYGRVTQWLATILSLDPRGQYPLLVASRVYSDVPVEAKQRVMLDFVYQEFFVDPPRRWPWLAHAAYVAKHRLKDMDLALKYARAIRQNIEPDMAPAWARQMEIFILEDMGELESARVMLGGLLATGTVTDSHEIWFLKQRLEELEARLEGKKD